MLKILFEIIDATEQGLPLGFYTSQWLSNWYLQGLDHYIKEELGAIYYIRYMDDMVIFGSNKRKLHQMRVKIEEYLNNNLGLKLKDNWQVFRFECTVKGKHIGRDLDFMGFRFFRHKTILRKSIMQRCTRKAKKISKKEHVTVYDARQMLSYNGYLKATDTYDMRKEWIEPYVNFDRLKLLISRYDKRRNEEMDFYKSESTVRPEPIDATSSKQCTYVRENIVEKQREDMDGNKQTIYEYDEAKLSNEEFSSYMQTKIAEKQEQIDSVLSTILENQNVK